LVETVLLPGYDAALEAFSKGIMAQAAHQLSGNCAFWCPVQGGRINRFM
jgi:hypothetical protein